MPVKPMAIERKAAPLMMKMIMHDVRVAPITLSEKFFQVSEPNTHDSTSEPRTPMVAASVGVAMPA